MKEIKKSASFKSKVKRKDKEVQFKIDLNYSPEYDSFNIKVKEGEGFMSYSWNIEVMPLDVVQRLNEMLEEVLIKAGSKIEMKEHKMSFGGDFQAGVYDEGGKIDLTDDNKLRLRKPAMPEKKLSEREWIAKHNESKEARTYGFGGLFGKAMQKPKPLNLDEKQVMLKTGEYVQVLDHAGDTLIVMDLNKLGSGAVAKRVKLYDVDMDSFKYGGALIGNQKRIDMNKNNKIDAEDFKILRTTINGAWRNERKHVNHNEDYEVRYAKPRPKRTGYKGKRKFGEGGGISNFERLSRVVAKNYVGKQVKPKYQKEYGKVYSKSEAKEVGDKVAGKMKLMKK